MSVARHTIYNLIGSVVPLAVSLVTVPLYLEVIGLERYGMLAIFWTLLGFLGFLSLGMGPAVTQRLATMAGASDRERSQLVWTAFVVNLAMALVGSLLVLGLAHLYFDRMSSTPAGLRAEVEAAIPWLAVALPVSLAGGVLAGALQGRQRFGILNIINSISAVGIALAPLATAYFVGPSLPGLAIATVGVNLLILAMLAVASTEAVPLLKPARPSAPLIRSLATYGGWMTGTTLLSPVVTMVDRFLIGALLGPAAVSAYVIPYNLVSRVILLPSSLGSATLPRFAGADRAEEQRLQSVTIKSLIALLTPISVVAIAALAPFLRFWIGSALAATATPIGVVLVAGFWMHGVAYVSSTIVMGRGRPDLLMKLLIAYLIPYLALLYLLTEAMGPIGAAIAWCFKAACDPLLLFVTKPDRSSVIKILEGAAVVVAGVAIGLILPWTSAGYWLGLAGLLALSCYLGWEILSHWLGRVATWTRVSVRA
jgi:O-antigen/teichoic acid export membrane protein